jgi:hypothetical protein
VPSADTSSPPETSTITQSRRRRPPPTGLTLSENALVGLYFIQRYRFLTIAQFGRAAGLKPSFSAELLRSLKARDFLGYFGNVGLQGRGKTPKIYYLTRKGYELLRRKSDIPGFDPDHGRGKLLEEGHHLLAPQLLTQNRRLGGIHPVKLENVLRRVHPNSANPFHGRFPLSEICNDLILAHSMPSGAVHSNKFRGC